MRYNVSWRKWKRSRRVQVFWKNCISWNIAAQHSGCSVFLCSLFEVPDAPNWDHKGPRAHPIGIKASNVQFYSILSIESYEKRISIHLLQLFIFHFALQLLNYCIFKLKSLLYYQTKFFDKIYIFFRFSNKIFNFEPKGYTAFLCSSYFRCTLATLVIAKNSKKKRTTESGFLN